MATTVKLQSPGYDNDGNGAEIPLPVSAGNYQLQSLADSIPLFNNQVLKLDLNQLEQSIQFGGTLTTKFATDNGFNNVIEMRDYLRAVRSDDPTVDSAWSNEDGPTVAGNSTWDDATLPAAEQDSEARATGKVRLIYDKEWDAGTTSLVNLFFYGTVNQVTFQRRGAGFRTVIDYGVSFTPSIVVSGT